MKQTQDEKIPPVALLPLTINAPQKPQAYGAS